MSIMKNINYIKRLSVISCSAPDMFVLAETGFQAALPALLSLGVPGCSDIVKMKLGHSPWHRRGIRGVLKAIAPPFAVEANKFLYKVGYFTAERGLYYWMLADVATEFVATWQSMIFTAQQCELPSAGTAYGYITPFIYGFPDPTLLQPTPIHNVTGMAVGLGEVVILPGFQGTVTFSAEWDSWPTRGQGTNVTTWMTEGDDPTPITPITTNQPPSQPKNQTMGHLSFDTLHTVTAKHYHFHVQNMGPLFAQAVAGTYTVNMQGHPQGVLPFGCKPARVSNPLG